MLSVVQWVDVLAVPLVERMAEMWVALSVVLSVDSLAVQWVEMLVA